MTQTSQEAESSWVLRHTIAFIGVFVAIIVFIVLGFQSNSGIHPFVIWLVLLGLFTAMTLIISRGFTHRWLGILIDDRNKYSLSRFQMILWTLIILSSFMGAVLANVRLDLIVYVSGAVDTPRMMTVKSGYLVSDVLIDLGILNYDKATNSFTAISGVDLSSLNLTESVKDGEQIYIPRTGEAPPVSALADATKAKQVVITTPLSVQIPSEVWLLLGISTTSLVASPLIKGQKQDVVIKNESVSEAKFGDLFKGEDEGNINLLDLGKVQLMYFTVIVIGAYMIAVANMFLNTNNAIASLPALDGGVIALLGVSHAGYLGNKVVKHNGDADAQNNDPQAGAAPPQDPLPHDPVATVPAQAPTNDQASVG